MIYRCILPQWRKEEDPTLRRVVEGELSDEEVERLNVEGYNAYYLPNYPSIYNPGAPVDGSQIDTFQYVFADMDLKDAVYATKEDFLERVGEVAPQPSRIVDSGNGIHVYWKVRDLDVMSYLRLQRRLIRLLNTDEAVGQIYQLMRVPGTVNTKSKEEPKLCELLWEDETSEYSLDYFNSLLPPITHDDEEYCKQHYDKTYSLEAKNLSVDDRLPAKFGELLHKFEEVKEIWCGNTDDRSVADFRLGHIMFANGFTKEEARSVLVNSAKALSRAPVHRIGYADGIVDKIWTYEIDKSALTLSASVKDILDKAGDTIKGTRLPCYRYLDATVHGFRLGQVIGLVAGSGVGKTAVALNMFLGFVENNPNYDHFFIPLEQPAAEIADRWKTLCNGDTRLYEKVHVLSNYDDDGTFRHLSFEEIKVYLLKFQEVTKRKIGCVVIDHIGALKKKGKEGENQDLMTICHEMKAFAVQTNTLLVMQSQSSREKAGIGDLEINKDAAYGTVYFESYCDYLITMWQPLKRCYSEDACPTVTAFKFCKIRHKKVGLDEIQEDVPYLLYFDNKTERLRKLTQLEEKSFEYFSNNAINKRKKDRKTDVVAYKSIDWVGDDGKAINNQDSGAATGA